MPQRESTDSSRFDPIKARISGKFYSRKDSQSTKLEQRSGITVQLSFGEFCDSKLHLFRTFGYVGIFIELKDKTKSVM